MAAGGKLRETEIKLPLPDAGRGRRLLRDAGFRASRRRVHEQNTVFDTRDRRLQRRGELLRLRTAGRQSILTFKGPALRGRHRSRMEIEVELSDAATARMILLSLGYKPVFWYEKYRTEYRRNGWPGLVTLDETPIEVYLELEGAPDWLDRLAEKL